MFSSLQPCNHAELLNTISFLIIRRTRQKERHGKTGRSRDVWRGAGRERGAICYSALEVNHIFDYASRPEMAGKAAEIHLVDRRV